MPPPPGSSPPPPALARPPIALSISPVHFPSSTRSRDYLRYRCPSIHSRLLSPPSPGPRRPSGRNSIPAALLADLRPHHLRDSARALPASILSHTSVRPSISLHEASASPSLSPKSFSVLDYPLPRLPRDSLARRPSSRLASHDRPGAAPRSTLAASCIHVSEPISSPLRWPRSARGLRVAPARSLSNHHRASSSVHHHHLGPVMRLLPASRFAFHNHNPPSPSGPLISRTPRTPRPPPPPARTLPCALPLSRTPAPRIAPTTHDATHQPPTKRSSTTPTPRIRFAPPEAVHAMPCHSSTSHPPRVVIPLAPRPPARPASSHQLTRADLTRSDVPSRPSSARPDSNPRIASHRATPTPTPTPTPILVLGRLTCRRGLQRPAPDPLRRRPTTLQPDARTETWH